MTDVDFNREDENNDSDNNANYCCLIPARKPTKGSKTEKGEVNSVVNYKIQQQYQQKQ